MTALSAREQKKAAHERQAFRIFSDCVGLPVVAESIESRPDPEPDILCSLNGFGQVAFELGRLDSDSLLEELGKHRAIAKAFVERLLPTGSARSNALERKFGRVALCVDFMHDSGTRCREGALALLVDWLIHEAHVSPVSHLVQIPTSFRPPIHGVRVLAPSDRFTLQAGKILTSSTTCSLATLRKKMAKKYTTEHPVELLVYSHEQSWDIIEFVKPQIEVLIATMLGDSPYQRVWVADLRMRGNLKLVYPAPPYQLCQISDV